METPFSDSVTIQERAEDKIQLSSAIADQILNKETFAASAQQHFVEWDKDNSHSLSLNELSDVYNSTAVNYEERATASILSENFDLFSSLCASKLQEDPNRKSYTNAGFGFLESKFGSDHVSNGITPKDLNVLSTLVSERGQEKFVHDAQKLEKQHLGLSGLITGVGGAATLASLGSLLAPGPIKFLSGAMFGVNTLATTISGTALFDGMRKDDLQLMEMQFKNRKAMLDSLDVPRL